MSPQFFRVRFFIVVVAVLGSLQAQVHGQSYRHGGRTCSSGQCSTGQCGSPLAGPCVPQRVTYGYVPTSWRRWPTDQASTAPPPEELPTPTPAKGATTPDLVEPLPSSEEQPLPETAPPQDTLETPFGNAPVFDSQQKAPAFGDEKSSPFGDEPQPPPSAADPLAVPFGDEPPMPPEESPARDAPAPPADPSPLDDIFAPTPSGAGSAPSDENLPPKMPATDPFQDDSEPTPQQDRGARHESSQGAIREYLLTRQGETHALPATSPTSGIDAMGIPSEPRLLRADGESLGTSVVPSDANPLRPVSHAVRRTSTAAEIDSQDVSPALGTSVVWRRNPLRAE